MERKTYKGTGRNKGYGKTYKGKREREREKKLKLTWNAMSLICLMTWVWLIFVVSRRSQGKAKKGDFVE
jgi:hypothetical protein